ncbi:MAG: DUF4276 family protein [Acidithiobacillus ferrooxidans]|uniref:DUF4276 family protein n=2 Tax=Acidithiobacillus sulfuriphilus TaxID=1867749 RepID=A0A3M8QYV4_9PROT|nr:DUF4276 family protein [Acidithiobacillus sulfuriphilus]RNF59640.1 DUF4276 family protein [Acidithiobacillus sulfuriphilus]
MLEKLIVFVEEPSMEATLEHLLPKLMNDVDFEIRRFQCKDDLLKNLPARLRGYSTWLPENWAILVLVDRDDDDCTVLKQTLEGIAARAGLLSKSRAGNGNRFQVANRIAIEELEAWFFGDWAAVQAAYPRVPSTIPQKTGYRDPDGILGGTWEALERILKRASYFKTGLRKMECARTVAQQMEPNRNTSQSFRAFVGAVSAATSL